MSLKELRIEKKPPPVITISVNAFGYEYHVHFAKYSSSINEWLCMGMSRPLDAPDVPITNEEQEVVRGAAIAFFSQIKQSVRSAGLMTARG